VGGDSQAIAAALIAFDALLGQQAGEGDANARGRHVEKSARLHQRPHGHGAAPTRAQGGKEIENQAFGGNFHAPYITQKLPITQKE
jgi:hypothetical protein